MKLSASICALLVENALDGDKPFDVKKFISKHVIDSGATSDDLDDVDAFTRSYLEAAEWTEENAIEEEAKDSGLDLLTFKFTWSLDALFSAIKDCKSFQERAGDLLNQAGDAEQNGHDFWLTRNGHGTGFWDRGYDEQVEKSLCALAKSYGPAYVYLLDNGTVDFQ